MNLRPMTMEDADIMLEWKNYPETRSFTIATNQVIRREDHIKYLEKNIQYFQIIRVEGEIIGAVRIQNNELAIWIDRKFWGRGLATEAIKLASVKGMTAKIVDRNINSIRAFINAGYKPIKFMNGNYDHILGQTNYYIFQL